MRLKDTKIADVKLPRCLGGGGATGCGWKQSWFWYWLVMPYTFNPRCQDVRDTYEWCAVIGWSAEYRRNGTPAMDLESHA